MVGWLVACLMVMAETVELSTVFVDLRQVQVPRFEVVAHGTDGQVDSRLVSNGSNSVRRSMMSEGAAC